MFIRYLVAAFLFLFIFNAKDAASADDGVGRFQLMDSAPITVIDTVTGGLWIVEESQQSGYYMRRVCYLDSDDKLVPTPNELYGNEFGQDQVRGRLICRANR